MTANSKPQGLKAGAIAAPDCYSAQAAEEMLSAGGNAVDAAIAAAFTLAVTYPEAGNIGGGGFMTIWFDGRPFFLDYREVAPMAATRNMYLGSDGNVIPGASVVGAFSGSVPGTVMGLWDAYRRFGTLRWSKLVAPAIRYARTGFIVHRQLVERRDAMLNDFAEKTNFTDYFGALATGENFVQPELAATLTRIAERGAEDFYSGQIADNMVAQIAALGGLIRREDLASYKTVWRQPIVAAWRGHQVVTAPPPSSGGVAIVQQLLMKETLRHAFEGVAHNSLQYIHLMAEIEKRVFADRAEYFGDPDFQSIPVDKLLDRSYIDRRANEVNPRLISPTANVAPGLQESDETTHFSIVDAHGNAVSNTFTLNSKFGSGVIVKGGGFLLNNDMDDFSCKPGVPNRFFLMGADANAIAPGKRMVSSMSPTLMTKDGKVSMVIGTPGGSRIFTSIFQVLNNLFDFKMPLHESVSAMRLHHQLHPENTVYWEPYAPVNDELTAELLDMGYNLQPRFTNGDIQVIRITDDVPEAVSDPRARGVSVLVAATPDGVRARREPAGVESKN